MSEVVNPIVLYLACAIAAVGLALALPRRRVDLAAVGITLAGIAAGMVLVSMGIRAFRAGELPTINFYIFAAIALLASVRMITHARPVYSALYFILTIIASCGLYLLLSAEFMAFALIIIYAGAILITYLFVIMLATQAPSLEEADAAPEYDTSAREPALAAGAGFLLLAALSTMFLAGVRGLPEIGAEEALARSGQTDRRLAMLARRVEGDLAAAGLLLPGERVHRLPAERSALGGEESGDVLNIDAAAGRVVVVGSGEPPEGARIVPVEGGPGEGFTYARLIDGDEFPAPLRGLTNVEQVGFNLLADHPGTIEIAGVILLMAMLGATVLARKRMELSEQQARERDARLLPVTDTPAAIPSREGGRP